MSEDIRDLVEGVVDGSISDDDLTSWLKQVHSSRYRPSDGRPDRASGPC